MITRRRFVQAAAAGSLSWAGLAKAADTSGLRKRGCCLVARERVAWRQKVERLDPAWMYSWGRRRPEGLPTGVEFTPMLWGNALAERQAKRIADLKRRADSGEVRHLLGFNEPDQHEQSNMTVDRAIELWPDLMSVGVPLVSPGCVHPDRVWMTEFMERVEQGGLRVDAIAVHSYMGPSVEILMRRLEEVYKKFGRPLWLTELAVGDWEAKTPGENKHRPERIEAFMRDLLPALDEASHVHRYAWFSAPTTSGPLGTSALFDEEGRLTGLGEVYASHAG